MSAGARECTHGCSPRAAGWFGQNHLGGVVSAGVRVFRLLGRPMSYVLFSWAEPWRGSRSPRDPGFMNPTIVH